MYAKIAQLIEKANDLDRRGFYQEADLLDRKIKKIFSSKKQGPLEDDAEGKFTIINEYIDDISKLPTEDLESILNRLFKKLKSFKDSEAIEEDFEENYSGDSEKRSNILNKIDIIERELTTREFPRPKTASRRKAAPEQLGFDFTSSKSKKKEEPKKETLTDLEEKLKELNLKKDQLDDQKRALKLGIEANKRSDPGSARELEEDLDKVEIKSVLVEEEIDNLINKAKKILESFSLE